VIFTLELEGATLYEFPKAEVTGPYSKLVDGGKCGEVTEN